MLFRSTHRYKPTGPVGGDFFTEFCSPQGRLDRLIAALTTIATRSSEGEVVALAQAALDEDADLRRIDESGTGPRCGVCGRRGCTPYDH